MNVKHTFYEDFKALFKAVRMALPSGNQQKDVAGALTVVPAYISRLEKGFSLPSNGLIKKISDYFTPLVQVLLDRAREEVQKATAEDKTRTEGKILKYESLLWYLAPTRLWKLVIIEKSVEMDWLVETLKEKFHRDFDAFSKAGGDGAEVNLMGLIKAQKKNYTPEERKDMAVELLQ